MNKKGKKMIIKRMGEQFVTVENQDKKYMFRVVRNVNMSEKKVNFHIMGCLMDHRKMECYQESEWKKYSESFSDSKECVKSLTSADFYKNLGI
jgi:hypothetical protein